MQRSRVRRNRVSLVRVRTLVLLAGAAGGLMWALIPGSDHIHAGDRSMLSIAYLETLVRAHPDQPAIRIHYARELLSTGRWDEAEAELRGLSAAARSTQEAEALSIELTAARAGAETVEARRAALLASLTQAMGELSSTATDVGIVERLAHLSLSVDDPNLAAEIYLRLSRLDPPRRTSWLSEAGRWFRASGDLVRAGRAFDARAKTERKRNDALQSAMQAIDCAVADSWHDGALQRCSEYLELFGDQPALLERCVEVALLAGEPGRARDWGRREVALRPMHLVTLEKQVARELAVGDTKGALTLARRMVQLAPNDVKSHETLANLADWSGDSAEALREWLWLARTEGSPRAIARAGSLAQSLQDPTLIETLLIMRAPVERLDEAQLAELMRACDLAGDSDHAAEALRAWLHVHPGARDAWVKLARLQERRGAAADAAVIWTEVAGRFGLVPKEAHEAATLLWKLRREDEGVRVMEQSSAQAGKNDHEYWSLLARLAWETGRDDLARRAYRKLWKAGVRERDVSSRLMELCKESDPALGVRVAVDSYLRWGDLSAVFAGTQMARATGASARALGVLELVRKDRRVSADPTYWSTKGAVLAALGRNGEARRHYWVAVELAPSNAAYLADLIWLDLEHAQPWQLARSLRRGLKIAPQNPRLWPAIAVALQRVGRPTDALVWYRLHAMREPTDSLWLLAYADALQQAGEPERAERIRQHVLVELHPKALQVLRHKHLGREEAKLVQARAILARRLEGAPAGYEWLDKLLSKTDEQDDRRRAQELAIAWYLSDGSVDLARKWLLAKHRARIDSVAWNKVARQTSGASLVDADRILGAYSGERPDAAIAAMDAASRSVPREQPTVQVALDWQRIGDLNVTGTSVSSAFSLGGVRLEPKVQGSRLGETDAVPEFEEGELEVDLWLAAWLRGKAGQAGLGVGLNDRAGDRVPRAQVEFRGRMADWLTLGFRGTYQEIPSDSPLLRVRGVRDDAVLFASFEPSARPYIGVEAGGFFERTRDADALAKGARASTEVGYRLWLRNPDWRVFASGGWVGRDLEDPDLSEQGIAGPLSRWLPERLATVGAGTQVSRGWGAPLENDGGPVHFLAELWGGWVDPLDEVGLRARGGLALRLFGNDELALHGYYLRAVTGSADVGIRGASLTYQIGLERKPDSEGGMKR